MSCNYKYRKTFMEMCHSIAKQSYAVRLQVGALLVKDNRVVSMSYNGTPQGCDNSCEHRKYLSRDAGGWLDPGEIEMRFPYVDENGNRYSLITKDEVIHAEQNAIIQMAKSTESIDGCVMFCTHAPCLQCAKMILQSGIKEVLYSTEYRSTEGLDYLISNSVQCTHLPINQEENK